MILEHVGPVIGKVSGCLSPHARYFFSYGKIVEEFENKREDLKLKNDRVKNDVDAARRRNEVIENDVQEWLKEAEKELDETQKLEAEIDRQNCFNWCPSWGWRYCLSKKIAEKTSSVDKLLYRCEFQRVGYHAPLKGIEFLPSTDFHHSKSSNLAFDGIMSALNTNGVNMIGLYGMPGVGKTTLVKEVGRHAKEQKLFDNVVMVTMSQTPKIGYIQGRIAELLGLKFQANTEEGKAEELIWRLKAEKKILIIIDDVWKEFNLQSTGIPTGVEHEGCKILLTMRLQQICARMRCQEKFKLDVLSKDEAWDLFKDNAGLKDDISTLNNVAKEVASECKGLPLAIVTIGKALTGASLDGWIAVNQRFKESRHVDNEDVCEDIYKCLSISYDYLKGDNIRSCFLLCSLFPEDFPINIELLVMFGVGYGLFSHIHSIESVRREIHEALRKLHESGLLLKYDDGDNEKYVSMHDVVRDFAHWKTSRGENMFMVTEGLTEWPTISESFGCYTAIAFWFSSINNFPYILEFTKLKFLVFGTNDDVRVPSAFVRGMKDLRVLYLKNVTVSLKVLQVLRNLRILHFKHCLLDDISSLKILENLEVLALFYTDVYELPEEIVALRGLKSLHFHFSHKQLQSNFPPNLLSRLTSLQELHVTCSNNVNLWELNSLSRLAVLSLTVSADHQCLPENFVFPELQRFVIAVNKGYLHCMEGLKFRTLEIKDFSSSLSAFKKLFRNVEILALENCSDTECLTDMTREKGLLHLHELNILHGHNLKEVFGFPQEMAKLQVPTVSNLTTLELEELPELKWIWKQPSHFLKLQSFKTVKIKRCMKLAYLFTAPLAQGLVHLEELRIWSCHSLEHVIMEEAENEDEIVSNMNGDSHHPGLLPKLTTLEISDCPRLKYVFQIPLAQVFAQLKSVSVINSPQLKHVFNVAKVNNGVDRGAIKLPRLRLLQLEKLKNLSCFCSENCPIVSPLLEKLTIGDCPQLEIFSIQQDKDEELQVQELKLSTLGSYSARDTFNCEMIFQIQVGQFISRIENICLKRIHQLQGPIQIESFHHLRELHVSNCTRLKSLFSFMLAQNLSQLNILHVEYCDELEEIIEIDQTSVAASSQGHLQPTPFPSLQVISICWCGNLKSLFSTTVTRLLPKLRDIKIHWASKLEQVFGYPDELNVEEDQKEIVLPELKDLKLSNLRNLKSFAAIGYYFRFPSLDYFEVTKCPRLTTSFNMDLRHPVHAITEAPQPAQNDTTEGVTTTKEIADNQSTCNDIAWCRKDGKDPTPTYMNVGETKVVLHKEMENIQEIHTS